MTTDTANLERRLRELTAKYGGWTAMSINLGAGIDTKPDELPDFRLQRIIQIAQDVIRRPLRGLRVLDLACLEGHYGIEFAMHGASVVGIEARTANIAKAQFAKESLGLSNIDFVQDDVRNLTKEKYGLFDVVICSGILYHLDAPDVFEFLVRIAEICQDSVVIDTYVAARPEIEFEFRGKPYWGRYYAEHSVGATNEQKQADAWASIDNVRSVWLTKPSLLNILAELGFTSVLECHNPSMPHLTKDVSVRRAHT